MPTTDILGFSADWGHLLVVVCIIIAVLYFQVLGRNVAQIAAEATAIRTLFENENKEAAAIRRLLENEIMGHGRGNGQ